MNVHKMLVNIACDGSTPKIPNNAILVFDAKNDCFYLTTGESFFEQYEKKLNELLKCYDSKYNELTNSFNGLQEKTNKSVDEIRGINGQLIDMVEKFIKSQGGEQ